MKRIIFTLTIFLSLQTFAQTELDGLMMDKNLFCAGALYGKTSWKNYWEGTFKRDNQNLGTVSANTFLVDGNYGIKDNLTYFLMHNTLKQKQAQGSLQGKKACKIYLCL